VPEAASVSPLYEAARLIEGRLCTSNSHCEPAMLVQGLLAVDTLDQIQARALHAAGTKLTVCFNSPGGTFEAASASLALASNVHTCVADLATSSSTSPTSALCASACAWAWMAGHQRAIFGDNTIGFHAPYEYDAPACAPGNWFKAGWSVVAGFVLDRGANRFNDTQLKARDELRLISLTKGPGEVYALRAQQAVELGLQDARPLRAVFYPAAEHQTSTAR